MRRQSGARQQPAIVTDGDCTDKISFPHVQATCDAEREVNELSQLLDERKKELRGVVDSLGSARGRVAALEMENSVQRARHEKVEAELKAGLQRQVQATSVLKRQLSDQSQLSQSGAHTASGGGFGMDSEDSDEHDDLEAEMIKGIAGSGISAFSLREEALEEEVAELQREHAGLKAASEAAKLALEKKLRDRENENEKQVKRLRQELESKQEELNIADANLKQAHSDAQANQAEAEKKLLLAAKAAEEAARESAASLEATMADLDKSMAESTSLRSEIQQQTEANHACKKALDEAKTSAETAKKEYATAIAELKADHEQRLQVATEQHSSAQSELNAQLDSATEAASAQQTEASAKITALEASEQELTTDLASANTQIAALQRGLDAREQTVETQKRELEEQSQAAADTQAKLKADVDTQRAEIAKTTKSLEQLQGEFVAHKKSSAQRCSALEAELSSARQTGSETESQLAEVRSALTEEKANCAKAAAELTKQKDQTRKDVAKLQETHRLAILELKNKHDNLLDDAKLSLRECQTKLTAAIASHTAQAEQLEAEKTGLEKDITDCQSRLQAEIDAYAAFKKLSMETAQQAQKVADERYERTVEKLQEQKLARRDREKQMDNLKHDLSAKDVELSKTNADLDRQKRLTQETADTAKATLASTKAEAEAQMAAAIADRKTAETALRSEAEEQRTQHNAAVAALKQQLKQQSESHADIQQQLQQQVTDLQSANAAQRAEHEAAQRVWTTTSINLEEKHVAETTAAAAALEAAETLHAQQQQQLRDEQAQSMASALSKHREALAQAKAEHDDAVILLRKTLTDDAANSRNELEQRLRKHEQQALDEQRLAQEQKEAEQQAAHERELQKELQRQQKNFDESSEATRKQNEARRTQLMSSHEEEIDQWKNKLEQTRAAALAKEEQAEREREQTINTMRTERKHSEDELRRAAAAEMENLRGEHATYLETVEKKHASVVTDFKSKIESMSNAHTTRLEEMATQANTARNELRQQHEQALGAEKTRSVEQQASLESKHAKELGTVQAERDALQTKADDVQSALSAKNVECKELDAKVFNARF